MRILSAIFWLALGFALYPLLFVPLMVKFWPNGLEAFVLFYAKYLRLWGV